MADITVIGNAVIDVCARPVGERVFGTGSLPVEDIRLSFGGDALNEAVILSRFGKRVRLVSKVGQDEAGTRILGHLGDAGVQTDRIIVEAGTDTSVNVVLINEEGERFFLTNPKGSQRRLTKEDVCEALQGDLGIVSFASIFVSPLLDIPAMTEVFCGIKKRGAVLAADMTKAKNGEKLDDLRGLLPYLDYILPNAEEASLLTGETDPCKNAELLVRAGASCAIVKCGARGCVVCDGGELYSVPAVPVEKCVDTTGAGDSFAAGFLWALSEGWPLRDSVRFANATASCAVERVGATEGVESLEKVMERYV